MILWRIRAIYSCDFVKISPDDVTNLTFGYEKYRINNFRLGEAEIIVHLIDLD